MTGRLARGVAVLVAGMASACAPRHGALVDLPARRDGAASAVFVLRSEECDANVGTLHVFERAEIAHGVVLAGVILVGDTSAAARVRSQLRAFDIPASLIQVSASTRDSLTAIDRRIGPSLAVYDASHRQVAFLPAPQSPRQLQQLVQTLAAIASRRIADR